jgi:hypothetical protein
MTMGDAGSLIDRRFVIPVYLVKWTEMHSPFEYWFCVTFDNNLYFVFDYQFVQQSFVKGGL